MAVTLTPKTARREALAEWCEEADKVTAEARTFLGSSNIGTFLRDLVALYRTAVTNMRPMGSYDEPAAIAGAVVYGVPGGDGAGGTSTDG